MLTQLYRRAFHEAKGEGELIGTSAQRENLTSTKNLSEAVHGGWEKGTRGVVRGIEGVLERRAVNDNG